MLTVRLQTPAAIVCYSVAQIACRTVKRARSRGLPRRKKFRIERNRSAIESSGISHSFYRKRLNACHVESVFADDFHLPVGDLFNRITSFGPDKVIIFVNIENSVHIFPDYFELTFVIFRRIVKSLGRNFVRGTQIRFGRIRRKNGLRRSSRISYRQIAACNEIFVIIDRRNIDYNRIYFAVAFRYSFEIFIGGRNFITVLAVLDCRKISAELFKEGFGRCKHP